MDTLQNFIKDNWLKYKSIFPALALLCLVYWAILSSIHSWGGVVLDETAYFFIATFLVVVWVIYIVFCVIHNRLPKSPQNEISVLFVIEAESLRLFEDVKYKLVSNFERLSEHNNSPGFSVVCIQKNRVAKYHLGKKEDALELLEKTGCLFLIEIRYSVDDIDNAEDYELSMNLGVRHPKFNNRNQSLLSQDLYALIAPVGTRRFEKKQIIDVFNFTSQMLVYVCQYILGLVCLLSGKIEEACRLLTYVRGCLETGKVNVQGGKSLSELVDERVAVSYSQLALEYMEIFKEQKDLQYLRKAKDCLNIANAVRQNSFFYCINMAYISIILDKDYSAAKSYIDKCKLSKQSQQNKIWLYSEAFLSAYSGQDPSAVYSKYVRAIDVPYPNWVELADYIEFVLDREPERMTLHLAAGMIYEAMDDGKLMKKHFSIFLDNLNGSDKRIERILISKMKSIDCIGNCNGDCSNCTEKTIA